MVRVCGETGKERIVKKITDNVYVESGFRGCNYSFIVTREGVVMIETPMVPAEAIKWRSEIAKYGQIRYVINNEPHYDHMSGNCFFGGILVAHEGSRQEILNATTAELEFRLKRMAPESLPLGKDFRFRPPDITLSERLTIYLGDHTFKLMHLPGHTPSQLAVYVPEERVVFTSDNVVNGVAAYMHQAVPYGWLESLKTIGELDVDIVVPGHGALCDRTYIPKMSALVQNAIDKVSGAIGKGWSMEQAQEKLSVPDIFPGLEANEMTEMVKRMNIAHLYEVLGK
jgi:cyclase